MCRVREIDLKEAAIFPTLPICGHGIRDVLPDGAGILFGVAAFLTLLRLIRSCRTKLSGSGVYTIFSFNGYSMQRHGNGNDVVDVVKALETFRKDAGIFFPEGKQ